MKEFKELNKTDLLTFGDHLQDEKVIRKGVPFEVFINDGKARIQFTFIDVINLGTAEEKKLMPETSIEYLEFTDTFTPTVVGKTLEEKIDKLTDVTRSYFEKKDFKIS